MILRVGIASPGVLAPSSTTTPGATFTHAGSSRLRRGRRGSPGPRRCRPQGSCPSRRFWLRSRHVRTLARPAALRDAPTLRGLVSCRSRPLESPFRAFPSRGAVPALAGPCFPVGSRSTVCRRGVTETFAAGFPVAPTLCRGSPLRAHRTRGPGRRFLAAARRGRRTRRARSPEPRLSRPRRARLARGRHAHFEALLPSRIRSRRSIALARVVLRGRCSPGLSFPLEIAPHDRGSGSSREPNEGRVLPAARPSARPQRCTSRKVQSEIRRPGSRTRAPPTCLVDPTGTSPSGSHPDPTHSCRVCRR